MILLFTDFGHAGPYIGQMKAVLAARAPDVPVIDLMHDAPRFQPRPAGHLLAALGAEIPAGSVVVAVVDPGVGSPRRPLVLDLDGVRLVGPDNGLFAPWLARAGTVRAWEITWRPQRLSASFHGRDLFAPVGAALACGADVPGRAIALPAAEPGDCAGVIYIDAFGNAMTGIRGDRLAAGAAVDAGTGPLPRADTFSAVPAGMAFWYVNSLGLVEVAVNQGSAAARLDLAVGAPVSVTAP